MAKKKIVVHNKSDKPDNIVEHEAQIYMECEDIENVLPAFLRSFFIYLRGNVLPMTRWAYLHDIKFFLEYMIDSGLSSATELKDISLKEFNSLKASDILFTIVFSISRLSKM